MAGAIIGQIPFKSLIDFADRYGIVGLNDFDDFALVVRKLDEFEVADINTRNKQTQ